MIITQSIRVIFTAVLVVVLYTTAMGGDEFEYDSKSVAKNFDFINYTGITFATGPDDNAVGLKFANGVLIKDKFSFSFGIGYDKYADESLIPLFGDLRFFPSRRSFGGSFLFADIGYSLKSRDGIKDFDKVGFYLNGGIGLIVINLENLDLAIDVDYKLQRVTENWYIREYHGSYSDVEFFSDSVNHGFLSVSAGITF